MCFAKVIKVLQKSFFALLVSKGVIPRFLRRSKNSYCKNLLNTSLLAVGGDPLSTTLLSLGNQKFQNAIFDFIKNSIL